MNKEDYYMNIDLLGKVYIKDMIIFYDEPLVFSCVNEIGNLFIANCSDETEETREWLFLPISEARLIKGLKGNISAYDLFAKPENSFLWKVIEDYNKDIANAQIMHPSQLTEDDLPSKDAIYNVYDNDISPDIETNPDVVKLSREERREIVDLAIEPDDGHIHEISCDFLSKVLKYTQNILYSIASKGEKITDTIKENNKMIVTGTYVSSFGIRLKSDKLTDIFGESKLQDSLKILISLLETKDDPEELKKILYNLSPNVNYRFQKFLEILNTNNAGLDTKYAFPNNYYKHIHLSKDDIKRNLNFLESNLSNMSKILQIDGKLIGINVEEKKFWFISNNGDKINGNIDTNINIDEYRLPKDVSVEVEETIEENELTQNEITKYKLLKLKYIEPK